jgi:hypothetical protein
LQEPVVSQACRVIDVLIASHNLKCALSEHLVESVLWAASIVFQTPGQLFNDALKSTGHWPPGATLHRCLIAADQNAQTARAQLVLAKVLAVD